VAEHRAQKEGNEHLVERCNRHRGPGDLARRCDGCANEHRGRRRWRAFDRIRTHGQAILGSIDIALAKAKTSILFNGPSENLWEYCNPGGPALVLEAFDTLFDKRDYATAEKFWSEDYVQHSSRIPPGRDGLFEVIKSRPPEFAYEPELIVAENDLVMIWGRFSGHGAGLPWDRREHHSHRGWASEGALGRIEDEVTRANSLSGLPMFGDTFPEER